MSSLPSQYEMDPIIEMIGFRLSTATILFHAAIADRLGIGTTDVKCYSILRQTGAISAGELAEHVGLTSGAITGVIDRLDRAGLVRRVPDASDRRRVVLELVDDPVRERTINELYAPMGQAVGELVAGYNETERTTIQDFITKATTIMEEETRKLRQGE